MMDDRQPYDLYLTNGVASGRTSARPCRSHTMEKESCTIVRGIQFLPHVEGGSVKKFTLGVIFFIGRVIQANFVSYPKIQGE